jgi:hypothetical protein
MAIEANGIEDIVGRPMRVAAFAESREGGGGGGAGVELRIQSRHDGERRRRVRRRLRDLAAALAVEHHHLAVEIRGGLAIIGVARSARR